MYDFSDEDKALIRTLCVECTDAELAEIFKPVFKMIHEKLAKVRKDRLRKANGGYSNSSPYGIASALQHRQVYED